MAIIMAERNGRSDDWVMKQHKQCLTSWLKDQNIQPGETKDSITISRLAEGPLRQVTFWNAYDINGYTYYTHRKDSKCVNQNTWLYVCETTSMYVCETTDLQSNLPQEEDKARGCLRETTHYRS
jgi:hypothetical protein